MPNKRHSRFGIKKFELADSNGYIYHIILYAGKDLDIQHKEGQAFGVVKKFMVQSRFLGWGYHFFIDNFYTKPKLAEYLLHHKTLLSGTIRSNSKDIPKEDMTQRLQVGQSKFWRKGEILTVAFGRRNLRQETFSFSVQLTKLRLQQSK